MYLCSHFQARMRWNEPVNDCSANGLLDERLRHPHKRSLAVTYVCSCCERFPTSPLFDRGRSPTVEKPVQLRIGAVNLGFPLCLCSRLRHLHHGRRSKYDSERIMNIHQGTQAAAGRLLSRMSTHVKLSPGSACARIC